MYVLKGVKTRISCDLRTDEHVLNKGQSSQSTRYLLMLNDCSIATREPFSYKKSISYFNKNNAVVWNEKIPYGSENESETVESSINQVGRGSTHLQGNTQSLPISSENSSVQQ